MNVIIVVMRKGEPIAMAEIKVPIQINLPDDWVEQIVNRLKNDPEAEWAEIVRCKDCKWKQGSECVRFAEVRPFPDDFCSRAERRTDEVDSRSRKHC